MRLDETPMIPVFRSESMSARRLAVISVLCSGVLSMSIVGSSYAADREADEAALKQRTAVFVEAVKSGDAKKVAGFWTDEGEYAGGDGVTIRGTGDLEEAYRAHFKEAGSPKVSHEIDGIRFLSRDTAVVEGAFESTYAKQKERKRAGFSTLFVREDGQWRIAVLREWSRQTTLRDLGWLIGEWSAKTEGGQVNSAYRWSDDQTVITMEFRVKAKEDTTSGRELITRDPATGAIRSWVFVGGGIGESDWSREGKRWVVNSRGLTAEGEEMTATNIFTPEGRDSFTYESINRTLDGEELPDIGPLTVKRTKQDAKSPKAKEVRR
jgi:uncharacterized protein (TIGR02246 family)